MKRLHKNGPIVIFEKEQERERRDEWGHCHWTECHKIMLLWSWKHGFWWHIDCKDFAVNEKKLGNVVLEALGHMASDPPVYYRLKEHLQAKGIWKNL